MNTKLKPGQEKTVDLHRTDGSHLLTVLISVFTTHVSFTFNNHPILNRALPTTEARLYMRFLLDQAKGNTPLWLLEQRAGDFTSAMAVADQAEQDLIAGINADLNMTDADREAGNAQLIEAAREIVTDARGWGAYRQSASRTAAPLTPAMRDVLDSADHNGWIPLDSGNRRQLLALAARGKVQLKRGAGRDRRVVGGWVVSNAERVAA